MKVLPHVASVRSTTRTASARSALVVCTVGALFSLRGGDTSSAAPTTQGAFVFAKPHANTPAVQELIRTKFADVGVVIESEGEITGEAIDANGHIDTHYYAIASKAPIMKPKELNVPTEKFADFFGEEWGTVLAENRAFNAIDMKAKLGDDDAKFEELWDATADGKRIKFGGGFYCGCIEVEGTKYYTFNAFFMSMRGKFTEPGSSIHYYVVSFDPSKLSWADFRGKVLGRPTQPTRPKDRCAV